VTLQEEAIMNDKSEQSANKHPRKSRLARLQVKDAKRQDADERLDDALRQTFPASDALSGDDRHPVE
jgi:hypothetical protein